MVAELDRRSVHRPVLFPFDRRGFAEFLCGDRRRLDRIPPEGKFRMMTKVREVQLESPR